MPVDRSRGPASSDLCCFCGQSVEQSDVDYVRLVAHWTEGGEERSQNWGAHRRCVADRMDARVAGTGPFFGVGDESADRERN